MSLKHLGYKPLEEQFLLGTIGKKVVIEDTSKNIYQGILLQLNDNVAIIETTRNISIIYNIAYVSYGKKVKKNG